ncbi:MAG: carboxypeptidase-like regulatory domain-containing protein [Candidatus Kapaibacterium sp.]
MSYYRQKETIIMLNVAKWSLLIAGIAVFNSCKTQPTAPTETATIEGRVMLMQNYWQHLPPFGGVNVTIEGTNFSAVTDDSGYYTLQDVPTGTYNVLFSKSGYGEVRLFSMSVTGGGNAPFYFYNNQYYTTLIKISNLVTTIREVEIKDTTLPTEEETTYLIAKGEVTPNPLINQLYDGIAVYLSHTSDVSSLQGHYTTFFYNDGLDNPSSYPIDTTKETFVFGITQNDLRSAGFNSGDSIYVATYGAPLYEFPPGDYYDPGINQKVLSSANQTPSPVIGVKLP